MMPLLDMQRRTNEIGRIRIGATAEYERDGQTKTRPIKLDTFRFTTNSPEAADVIAEQYGGEVRKWKGGTQAFEIVTTASTLGVTIPAGEAALSQWWELWSGGGVQRRCDGITEQLRQQPCSCPVAEGGLRMDAAARGAACKPTTRVNVILPDLPGLGVWRYESHGYTAALELGGTADFLARARSAGIEIPAVMRIEPRESVKNGETRKWNVVVLDPQVTLRELLTGGGPRSLAEALPPALSDAKAIEAPKTPPGETASEPTPPRVPDDGPGSPGGQKSQRPTGRGSRTAAGTPTSAQEIADEVRTVDDVDRLTELAKACQAHGWNDVMVEDAEGVLEPLWDALTSRKAALDAAEGAA